MLNCSMYTLKKYIQYVHVNSIKIKINDNEILIEILPIAIYTTNISFQVENYCM